LSTQIFKILSRSNEHLTSIFSLNLLQIKIKSTNNKLQAEVVMNFFGFRKIACQSQADSNILDIIENKYE